MRYPKDIISKVKKVLSYNSKRRYFYTWSPHMLHSKYIEAKNDEFETAIFDTNMHKLSIICDALWTEMSFNPKRFGTENLFESDNKIDINTFVSKFSSSNDLVLIKIANYLDTFLHMYKNGLNINHLKIRINTGCTCAEYKAFALLVKCIHEIANQNIKDIHNENQAYFAGMLDVVQQRYPDFVRPLSNKNFAKIQFYTKNADIQKTLIQEKEDQISYIQMEINTLTENDRIVDISQQECKLDLLCQELAQLQDRYYNLMTQIQLTQAR